MHARVTSNSRLPDKLNDSPSKMPVFAPSASVRGDIRCYGGAAIMFMYPSFLPSYTTDQILQSLHHHRGAEAIQSVGRAAAIPDYVLTGLTHSHSFASPRSRHGKKW